MINFPTEVFTGLRRLKYSFDKLEILIVMTHDFCNSFKLRRKLILLELKFKIYMDDNAVKENYKVKIV